MHGLYNSSIDLPSRGIIPEDFALVGTILLALSAWRYFDLLDANHRPSGQRVSVLATFVLGTALMIGISLPVATNGGPPYPDGVLFLLNCVTLIPVAFIYIHRFRNA
ncbi:MAG: hypothetical protein AAF191_07300 [Verrucomicrobiota bacterium]